MRGYRLACLIVGVALLAIAGYVAAGYGVPGGSIYRRMTGREGPTGGLTTAMRAMLHGHFAAGARRHPSAPYMFAYLCAQVGYRAVVVIGRPRLADWAWLADLIGSLLVFAAAIYVPYWFTTS